MFLINIAASRT